MHPRGPSDQKAASEGAPFCRFASAYIERAGSRKSYGVAGTSATRRAPGWQTGMHPRGRQIKGDLQGSALLRFCERLYRTSGEPKKLWPSCNKRAGTRTGLPGGTLQGWSASFTSCRPPVLAALSAAQGERQSFVAPRRAAPPFPGRAKSSLNVRKCVEYGLVVLSLLWGGSILHGGATP